MYACMYVCMYIYIYIYIYIYTFLRVVCVCGAGMHSLLHHRSVVGQGIDEEDNTGVCGRGGGGEWD